MTPDVTLWSLIVDAIPNLVGTAIGGAMALLLYVYRLNRERKQILRAALFNLLEVWNVTRKIVRFDSEKAVRLIFEGVCEQFEEVPSIEQIRQDNEWQDQAEKIEPVLEAAARKMILQITPDELNELTARYREAVINLSAEEPLLAHSLYREYNLEQVEHALGSYFDHVSAEMENDEDLSDFRSPIKEKLSEEALDRMEEDLKTLAWKAGPVLWWKTTRKINEKEGPEPAFSDDQMSENGLCYMSKVCDPVK